MIVKNEAHVIEKCLATVKNFIDYWVIFDTGSTDKTQDLIRDYLKDVPGELHESPWVNFAHNRNEVLSIAKEKADFSLIIDADEQLILQPDFKWPDLSKDMYNIIVRDLTLIEKWFLINHEIDWKWVGVMHETIISDQIRSKELIEHAYIFSYNDGARSKDPQKILKDAQLLEQHLQNHPDDLRSRFYAGICYYNSAVYDKALHHFFLRSQTVGDDRELFMSFMMQGKIQQYFKKDASEIIKSYERACAIAPYRAEPWFYLGVYYQELSNFEMSYQILKKAQTDVFFEPFYQEKEIYDWKLSYFLARSCLMTKRVNEIYEPLSKVILCKTLPEDVRVETEKNLHILEKMR